MKQGSTLFLKLVIYLLGIAVLALCIFFTIAVMRERGGLFLPILFVLYATAIPFFFALWETLKLLGLIDKSNAFSELSVKALKNIKYSALAIGGLYTLGMPFIITVADKDDAPGAVGIGLVIIFASIVVATFAAVLQKLLQDAIHIKSENDLTV